MVRTPNLGSVQYAPTEPPQDAAEMRRFLFEEFRKIQVAIYALAAGHLDVTHAAPAKPRQGDIRYADGTNWNPAAGGEGIYFYNAAGSWVKLG